MSNTIYHNHHIIPRHMGGSNDPSNLKRITVSQHAEEHRKLYEQHNRLEDKLAWKMLEGQALMGDNLRIKSRLGWEKANANGPISKGRKWYRDPVTNECRMLKPTDEIPEGWVKGRVRSNGNRDYKNVSEEHKIKVSESMKKAWADGRERWPKGRGESN
jgi:hypothetical protein